jgi:hypothetical protein
MTGWKETMIAPPPGMLHCPSGHEKTEHQHYRGERGVL